MTQNIEIEFKNMLTEAEFTALCRAFSVTAFTRQTNHYLETAAFSLKETGSALRIREKNGAFTLTLKQPAAVGLLETNQRLTPEAARHILAGGPLPDGEVKQMLGQLGISADALAHFGSLTTERAELSYENGLLVFDHSFYFDEDDYELEYEVTDEAEGKAAFVQLLAHYDIPVRPTKNKVQRFFLAKQKKAL